MTPAQPPARDRAGAGPGLALAGGVALFLAGTVGFRRVLRIPRQ